MNDNQGIATCAKCGADIFPGATDCPRCGYVHGHAIDGAKGQSVTSGDPPKQEIKERSTSLAKSARPLVYAAALLWLASLALPGFVVLSRTEPWTGANILLGGLLFGWLVLGFAVYANLFFVPIAIQLLMGRSPRVSAVLMVALAATLPLFKGVIQDEGSGNVLPVVSWGWGAVLWVASITLLALAAAASAGSVSKLGVRIVGASAMVTLAYIGMLHIRQSQQANEQEREIYLSSGVAFTRAQMCGVPFTWPAASLIASDAIVALDIDPKLKEAGSYVSLPALMRYREDSFDWVKYRPTGGGGAEISVRSPVGDRPAPTLQVKQTKEGAVIRVLEAGSARVLYEQQLKSRPRADGYVNFCPYARPAWSGLVKGYDAAVARALGVDGSPLKTPHRSLQSEAALQACDVGADDIDGVDGLRAWDGREVVLMPEWMRKHKAFCSSSYIALTYLTHFNASDSNDLSAYVRVYDRQSLEPLAAFAGQSCPPGSVCKEGSKEIISGVRIADQAAVVVTGRGELTTRRQ